MIQHSRWLIVSTILISSPAWAEEPVLLGQINATTTPIAEPQTASVLTLEQAIEKALKDAPRLQSARSARDAGRGEQLQAGVLPNPEIGMGAENIAGRKEYRGFDAAEVNVGVSQMIELGGKRESRVQAADQSLRLREFDLQAEKLDVIRDVTIAYADAVAAQEALTLAAEQKKLAQSLLKDVNSRVDSAREPLMQRSKTEISVAMAEFAHERAERELVQAKHVLASLWGSHQDGFTLGSESFYALTSPMGEGVIETALEKNPNLKRWEAEKARAEAVMSLEKAQGVPDPRINVGVRDFRESNTQALMVGLSIPIPVFNSNQGNIERARNDIAKASSDEAASKLSVRSMAFQAHKDMTNAYRQAQNLVSRIIPSAKKSFELSREGYNLGRLPYLEVLDSQRTLSDARTQYIASLRDYHKARAELERFTAVHSNISNVSNDNDQQ